MQQIYNELNKPRGGGDNMRWEINIFRLGDYKFVMGFTGLCMDGPNLNQRKWSTKKINSLSQIRWKLVAWDYNIQSWEYGELQIYFHMEWTDRWP